MIYGVIVPAGTTMPEFLSYFAPKISEAMEDPETIFAFASITPWIFQYLSKLGFRNCIVYGLVSEKPRIVKVVKNTSVLNRPSEAVSGYESNTVFQTKYTFLSHAEIEAEIRLKSDQLITKN